MELKKSNEANLETMRTPLFLVGLLFIGSLTLAGFTYQAAEADGTEANKEKRVADVQVEKVKQEEKKEEDAPKPTPQIDVPPPPAEEIKVKENVKDTVQKVAVYVPTEIKMGPIVVPVVEAEVVEFPDVDATYPGGIAELQKWIAKSINYPQTSIELGEQGKVFVSFVVEPDGAISNVAVERGVSEDLDREAKRVVRSMPKWTAGEAGGKKVRSRMRLPIVFTLN
jgi:protein TonB